MIQQDNFSVLKGHVRDGQKIQMKTGEIFTLKSVMPTGWDIYDDHNLAVFSEKCDCAGDVECKIVNY